MLPVRQKIFPVSSSKLWKFTEIGIITGRVEQILISLTVRIQTSVLA